MNTWAQNAEYLKRCYLVFFNTPSHKHAIKSQDGVYCNINRARKLFIGSIIYRKSDSVSAYFVKFRTVKVFEFIGHIQMEMSEFRNNVHWKQIYTYISKYIENNEQLSETYKLKFRVYNIRFEVGRITLRDAWLNQSV